MGRVLKKLEELRDRTNIDLLERYSKLVGARGIREYLGHKIDPILTVEINLAEEEIIRRMSRSEARVFKN